MNTGHGLGVALSRRRAVSSRSHAVLQVRVQRDDALAPRALERRHDGEVLAEVAVQHHDAVTVLRPVNERDAERALAVEVRERGFGRGGVRDVGVVARGQREAGRNDRAVRADEGDLYNLYKQLQLLSKSSYKHFLQGDWEYVLLEAEVDNVLEVFKYNFKQIDDLRKQHGPCNILFGGLDTQMLKPTEMFGRWDNFMMFNYTDPKSHREFTHHLNDDVQYYPHTMSEETWELGEKYWEQREEHPDRHWGFDQLRHNAMFWSQNIEDPRHPEMNYMCMRMRQIVPESIAWHEEWNQFPFLAAHILHFCASRQSASVITTMKWLCEQLGIEYE